MCNPLSSSQSDFWTNGWAILSAQVAAMQPAEANKLLNAQGSSWLTALINRFAAIWEGAPDLEACWHQIALALTGTFLNEAAGRGSDFKATITKWLRTLHLLRQDHALFAHGLSRQQLDNAQDQLESMLAFTSIGPSAMANIQAPDRQDLYLFNFSELIKSHLPSFNKHADQMKMNLRQMIRESQDLSLDLFIQNALIHFSAKFGFTVDQASLFKTKVLEGCLMQSIPLSDSVVNQVATTYQLLTEALIKKTKVAYLPFSVKGCNGHAGHAIVLKVEAVDNFEDKGPGIFVTILNLGDGASENPVLEVYPTHEKVSFHSYPVFFRGQSFLTGDRAAALFTRLCRYNWETSPAEYPFRSAEILGVLKLFGELAPQRLGQIDQLAKNRQRGPTCTDKAARNTLCDALISQGCSKVQTTLLLMNLKFGLMLSALNLYQKKPTRYLRELMIRAIKECGTALIKRKDLLIPEERQAMSLVVQEAKAFVHSISVTEELPPCSTTSIENLVPSLVQVGRHDQLPPINLKNSNHFNFFLLERNSEIYKSYSIALPSVISVEELPKLCDSLLEQIAPLTIEERRHLLFELTTKLPMPSPDRQDDWTSISPLLVEKICSSLHSLFVYTCQSNEGECSSRISLNDQDWPRRQFLMVIKLLCICDRLNRQEGLSYSLANAVPAPSLFIDTLFSDGVTHLFDGQDSQQIAVCWDYLVHLRHEKVYYCLFPIAKSIPLYQIQRGLCEDSWMQSHARFMSSRLDSSGSHHLSFWLGEDPLPKALQAVRYFSHAFWLIYAQAPYIPPQISYTACQSGGQPTLSLNVPFLNKLKGAPPETKHLILHPDLMGGGHSFKGLPAALDLTQLPYYTLTVNDSLCMRLDRLDAQTMSDDVFQNLLRITRISKLALPLALDWMRQNYQQLKDSKVCLVLNGALFQSGAIYRELSAILQFATKLRQVVDDGLKFFDENMQNSSAIFYLLFLGISFESHIQDGDSKARLQIFDTACQRWLQSLSEAKGKTTVANIQDKLSSQIRLLEDIRLFAWAYNPIEKEAEAREAINLLFSPKTDGRYHDHCCSNWLPYRVDTFKRQIGQKLALFLNPALAKQAAEAALGTTLVGGDVTPFALNFPLCQLGIYTINFLTCHVHVEQGGDLYHLDINPTNYEDPSLYALVQSIGRSVLVQNNPRQFRSVDSKVLISRDSEDDKRTVIQQKIMIGTEECLCELLVFDSQYVDSLRLPFFYGYIPYDFYRLLQKQKGDPDMIWIDRETREPYLCGVEEVDGSWRFYLYGRPEVVLINLNHLNESHPLHYLRGKVYFSESTLILYDTREQRLEEIYFYRTGERGQRNLRFKRTSAGLVCKQFPGFCLEPTHRNPELGDWACAWRLVSDRQGDKILAMKFGGEDLAPASETLSKRAVPQSQGSSEQAVIYGCDAIHGCITHKDPNCLIYAIKILRLQGETTKAFQLLQRLPKTGQDRDLFAAFSTMNRWQDSSPEATALDLHLALIIIDQTTMLEEAFLIGHESSYFSDRSGLKEFIENAATLYERYLSYISTDEVSAIPRELLLSRNQEQEVLRYFNKMGEKVDFKLSFILRCRFTFVCTAKRELPITIDKKAVCPNPDLPLASSAQVKKFEHVYPTFIRTFRESPLSRWPNSPIRVTQATLMHHFMALAERATSPDDPLIDLDIVTAFYALPPTRSCKSSDKEQIHCIATLLWAFRQCEVELRQEIFKTCKNDISIFLPLLCAYFTQDGRLDALIEAYRAPTMSFDYRHSTKLIVPQAGEQIALPALKPYEAAELDPSNAVRSLLQLLFTAEPTKTAPPSMPWKNHEAKQETDVDRLEDALYKRLEEGYRNLHKSQTERLVFRKDADASALMLVQKHQRDLQERKKLLEQQIRAAASTPYELKTVGGKLQKELLDSVVQERLAQDLGHKYPLLLPHIMQKVVLANDLSWMKREFPLLADDQMLSIVADVKQYYYVCVVQDGLAKAADLIQKPPSFEVEAELERLLRSLDYDWGAHPEVAYYKIEGSDMLPYPHQMEAYSWLCERWDANRSSLAVLRAGDGKTSLLWPLAALYARRLRKLAILMTPEAAYTTEKENTTARMQRMGEMAEVLEVGLHTNLTDDSARAIFRRLEQMREKGRPLVITPQTYAALKLFHRHAAIVEKNSEKFKWLENTLNFFKEHALLVIDETHRNTHPLTRSILGVGEPFNLPAHETEMVFHLMKPLLGFVDLGIHKMAGLLHKLAAAPQRAEVDKIRSILAKHAARYLKLEGDYSFLFDEQREIPPGLLVGKEKKWIDQLAVARHFLCDLLDVVLSRRPGHDYQHSLFKEQDFFVPAYQGNATTAHFQDPYETAALSIAGYVQGGLTQLHLTTLLREMVKEDWETRDLSGSLSPKERFASWVAQTECAAMTLQNLNFNDQQEMTLLYRTLARHLGVIEYQLEQRVFQQIGHSLQQLVATPAHLVHDFGCVTHLTATPGMVEIYPAGTLDILWNPTFEAHALSRACEAQNQAHIVLKSGSCPFAQLKTQPDFERATVLLDPGSLFDGTNEEIAQKWLDANPKLEGVLYFTDTKDTGVDRKEHLKLLLRDKTVMRLQGSNVKESLGAYGLNWEQMHLGTFYDAPHTESSDIPQKDNAHSLLWVCARLTTSQIAQSLLRMRGFLNPHKQQSVTWIYMDVLAAQLPERSPQALVPWSVRNEATALEEQVALAALHDVAHTIERFFERQRSAKNPMEFYLQNQAGFLELLCHDPLAQFGRPKTRNKMRSVLFSYAEQLYSRFKPQKPFSEEPLLVKAIEAIAKRIERYITGIEAGVIETNRGNVQEQTRTLEKQKQKQLDFKPPPYNPLASKGVYGSMSICNPDFHQHIIPILLPIQALFPMLSPKFFLSPNQLSVATLNGVSQDGRLLKPIDFIVILDHPTKGWIAYAQANEIIVNDAKDLTQCKDIVDNMPEHRAFIVRGDGTFYRRGRGAMAMSDARIQEIMGSELFADIIADAQLLQGRVIDKENIRRRFQKNPNLVPMWERIWKGQPTPETITPRFTQQLFNLLGLSDHEAVLSYREDLEEAAAASGARSKETSGGAAEPDPLHLVQTFRELGGVSRLMELLSQEKTSLTTEEKLVQKTLLLCYEILKERCSKMKLDLATLLSNRTSS